MIDTRTGAQRIADERSRQIAKEGWTPEHDDESTEGELTLMATLYETEMRCNPFGYARGDLNPNFRERLIIDV